MHDDLAVAAAYLGLSESDLRTKLRSGKTLAEVADATDGNSAKGLVDALVAAARKNVAADVASGRLTQSQADRILAGLEQHVTARVDSTGPPAGPHGHGGPRGGLDAAAAYLGITESDLMSALRSGKTLGQVADATAGKSKAGLVAALVADEKSHLSQAVEDGRLTQAQADQASATIEARVTDLVNGKLPARPDGPPPGDDGPPPGAEGPPPA
jgi:hypothetical protein